MEADKGQMKISTRMIAKIIKRPFCVLTKQCLSDTVICQC